MARASGPEVWRLLGHEGSTDSRWSSVAPAMAWAFASNASASASVLASAERQLALDLRVRDGRAGGEPGGQFLRGRQHQFVVVDERGQQAEPVRLGGVDRLRRASAARSPSRGRRAAAASTRRRCRRPARRWRTPSGSRSSGRRSGSRPGTRARHRRRRPCRGPRRSPACPCRRGAARSGCSAPRPWTAVPVSPDASMPTCSRRSWPTQKARPAPVSTTARTASSAAIASSVSRSSSFSAMFSEFSDSGRLSVSVATPSVMSTSSDVMKQVLKVVVGLDGWSAVGLRHRCGECSGTRRRSGRRPAGAVRRARRRTRPPSCPASSPAAASRAAPDPGTGTYATSGPAGTAR